MLKPKGFGDERVKQIAKELVHDYKDHGFVIDLAEAREHLGDQWVKDNTIEIAACEEIYTLFTEVNSWLQMFRSQKILIIGDLATQNDVIILRQQA